LVVVNLVGTAMFVEVDTTTMVSSVVTGTVSVWTLVVAAEDDVAFLNGAVVFNGVKVEKETLGILVGKGWAGGFPAVSRVVCSVYMAVSALPNFHQHSVSRPTPLESGAY
jgi:hypothetical protein